MIVVGSEHVRKVHETLSFVLRILRRIYILPVIDEVPQEGHII